jgi:hypothetical protein
MRIIAELPHPDCKITIFSMNGKFIIKFEQGTLEQTFKLAEMDLVNGVDGVFEILDTEFIASIISRFTEMRRDFLATYHRYH